MKCLILEDELSAREVILSFIDKTPFISCLGVYESGLDIPPSEMEQADLLFLDIHLPEINGMSYLKSLDDPPKVIVTSAYSNYAIEAFEQAIVDYLVKPFSYERFFKAVSRVQQQVSTQSKELGTVLLYADKTTYRVELQDILYFEAQVDYVKVVTINKEVMVLDSLQNWENKLTNMPFARIHRSFLVNLKKVEHVSGGQLSIAGKSLAIGRTYKENFLTAWTNRT